MSTHTAPQSAPKDSNPQAPLPLPPKTDLVQPAATVFQNRSFLALLAAQLISNLGDAMHSLALIWLMNLLTHGNPLWMAMISVMQMIPNILLAPFAGVFVDRWPKLRTMRTVDLISAVLVGAIALLAFANHLQPILLLGLTFLLATAAIFFNPAKQVLLTRICPQDELLKANAASQVVQTVSQLGGPIVAGLLIALVGPYLVFAINAASFVASFLLLATLRLREERQAQNAESKKPFWHELNDGFQTIKSIDVVRACVPVALLLNFLFAPMNVFVTKMVTDVFHGGAVQLSYLEAGSGFGMLLGSLLVGLVAKKLTNGQIFLYSLFGGALGLLGFSLSHTLWLGIVMVMLMCVCIMMLNTSFFTVLQKQIPADKMGRVFGLLQTGFGGASPLANFTFGFALKLLLINKLMLLVSIGYLGTSCYAWTKKTLRNMA